MTSLYFYKIDDYVKYLNDPSLFLPKGITADVVYAPALELSAEKSSQKTVATLPYVTRGVAAKRFAEGFARIAECCDGFLIQNTGDIELLRKLSEENGIAVPDLYGDYSLNVTNTATAEYYLSAAEKAGARLCSLAILPELEENEALLLADTFPESVLPEICIDNNVIVMRSEHCFAAKKDGYRCGNCGKKGYDAPPLKDIHGNVYPLLCNPLDCSCIMLAPQSTKKANEKGTRNALNITGAPDKSKRILRRISVI